MSLTKKANRLGACIKRLTPWTSHVTKIAKAAAAVLGVIVIVYGLWQDRRQHIAETKAERAMIEHRLSSGETELKAVRGDMGRIEGKVDLLVELQSEKRVTRPLTIDPHAVGIVTPGNTQ